MRKSYFLFSLLNITLVFSQSKTSDFDSCKTLSCKIEKAIELSEYYLENDKISESQKWLDFAKNNITKNPNAKNEYLINSLQSELFYYMGLYQFGLHEAQKGIELSKEINDSLYISNSYLIEGVNYFEIPDLKKAEESFHLAKKYFPENSKTKNRRFEINREYIYNNLAQLKIKTKQLDSSYLYNKKAYFFAKKMQNFRCIANVERTFGELSLKQNDNYLL